MLSFRPARAYAKAIQMGSRESPTNAIAHASLSTKSDTPPSPLTSHPSFSPPTTLAIPLFSVSRSYYNCSHTPPFPTRSHTPSLLSIDSVSRRLQSSWSFHITDVDRSSD